MKHLCRRLSERAVVSPSITRPLLLLLLAPRCCMESPSFTQSGCEIRARPSVRPSVPRPPLKSGLSSLQSLRGATRTSERERELNRPEAGQQAGSRQAGRQAWP